jgi:hypothetical protein
VSRADKEDEGELRDETLGQLLIEAFPEAVLM